jgi:hypothetical protein
VPPRPNPSDVRSAAWLIRVSFLSFPRDLMAGLADEWGDCPDHHYKGQVYGSTLSALNTALDISADLLGRASLLRDRDWPVGLTGAERGSTIRRPLTLTASDSPSAGRAHG